MNKRLFFKISLPLIATALLAISPMFLSSASAIPPVIYVGDGTINNPYQIENCSQLVFVANNLEANYKLMNNIDCTTHDVGITEITPQSFAYDFPIGSEIDPFLGSLDGGNHTITNVDMLEDDLGFTGMFGYIGEGAEVKDLEVTNVVINTNQFYAGALAGGNGGTITNVTTAGEITGGIITGGLVGSNLGDIIDSSTRVEITSGANSNGGFVGQNQGTISHSFATGEVIGGEFTGGFAGENYGAISQSFSTGNVTGSFTRVGGFVGSSAAGTITDCFSRGNVSGVDSLGGFVGGSENESAIVNSYSTGTVTTSLPADPVPDVDSFAGAQNGAISNSFFDATVSGSSDTTSDAVGKSTSLMKTKSTFTDAGWDFDSIWAISSLVNDGYPTFQSYIGADVDDDGISNSVENAGPNGGDANNDGTNDSEQDRVASFPSSVTGQYVVVDLTGGCAGIGSASTSGESSSHSDVAFAYPVGLVNFTITGCANGETASIKLYFYNLNNASFVARKFNSATNAYTTIPGASVSQTTIAGLQVTNVTYQVTDGSSLDSDGSANGTIIDPVGLGQAVIGAPRTGGGGTAGK